MANAQVKISQLPLSNTVTDATILPVVNNAITNKVTALSLKNYIGEAAYGNANVEAFLPTYEGDLSSLKGDVITTTIVQAGYLYGDGSNITNISATSNSISNGNSNVSISTSNGNILAYVGGVQAQRLTGDSVSVGAGAAGDVSDQGSSAVAIGTNAGRNSQSDETVAIGAGAGATSQRAQGVAIGFGAGGDNQGTRSIAIGANAGTIQQPNNSIILNATNSALNQTVANTFTVRPVREVLTNTNQALYYDTTTGEITYAPPAGGSTYGNANVALYLASGTNSNDIVTTANVTSSNITVSGNVVTGNIRTDNYQYANGQPFVPTASANSITNGSSSVSIPQEDSDIVFRSSGTNVAVFSTGESTFESDIRSPRFIGQGDRLSNLTGGNVVGAVAFAEIAQTVSDAAQPEITSVGTLTSLTVDGNITTANGFFVGDGGFLSNIQSSNSIINGNSNVVIGSAGGNITFAVAGNSVGTLTPNSIILGRQSGNTSNTVVLNPSNVTIATTNNSLFATSVRIATNSTANTGNVLAYNPTTREVTFTNAPTLSNNTFPYFVASSNQNISITAGSLAPAITWGVVRYNPYNALALDAIRLRFTGWYSITATAWVYAGGSVNSEGTIYIVNGLNLEQRYAESINYGAVTASVTYYGFFTADSYPQIRITNSVTGTAQQSDRWTQVSVMYLGNVFPTEIPPEPEEVIE